MKKRQYSRNAKSKKDNQHPVRKISETLLDFAHPFIEMIDGSTTQQDIENGLTLAITVWNSLVFEVVQNDPLHLERLRNSILKSDNPEGWMMMEDLIKRKREKFADDLRAISDFSVTYSNGNLNVRAEARKVPGKGVN
jgi:hypothetical protein